MEKAAKPIDHVQNCNLSHKVQLLNQKMRSKQNKYSWSFLTYWLESLLKPEWNLTDI